MLVLPTVYGFYGFTVWLWLAFAVWFIVCSL
jgi:hypothetical protein